MSNHTQESISNRVRTEMLKIFCEGEERKVTSCRRTLGWGIFFFFFSFKDRRNLNFRKAFSKEGGMKKRSILKKVNGNWIISKRDSIEQVFCNYWMNGLTSKREGISLDGMYRNWLTKEVGLFSLTDVKVKLTDAATNVCLGYEFLLQASETDLKAGGKSPLWLKTKHKLLKLKGHGEQYLDMKNMYCNQTQRENSLSSVICLLVSSCCFVKPGTSTLLKGRGSSYIPVISGDQKWPCVARASSRRRLALKLNCLGSYLDIATYQLWKLWANDLASEASVTTPIK